MFPAPSMGALARLAAAIGLLASAWFYATALWSARGLFRRGAGRETPRPPAATEDLPGVTVLKPLKGLEEGLFENLATFCRQDYPTFQIVCGVADPADPAVEVVRRLQAAYPRVRVDLVVDSRVYGTNYKVSNLHHCYRRATHPVIVVADSDIRVPEDYLRRVVAPLADPTVGVVTCLYRAAAGRGLPSSAEKLFINTDFATMVLVARVVEKPSYVFGATMALRRSVLDEIGGFLPLADYLADDYYLGQRVSARGYRLALSDLVVETVPALGSWKALFDHQLRWARTNRSCRPAGYFGSVFTHGAFWACVNLLLHGFAAGAWSAAAAVIGLRVGVAALLAGRYMGAPLRWYEAALLPVKDLVVTALWALAFTGNTVRWGGHEFRVARDGRMVRVGAPAGERGVAVPAYVAAGADERDGASATRRSASGR